jgi:hypothetical protein
MTRETIAGGRGGEKRIEASCVCLITDDFILIRENSDINIPAKRTTITELN